MAQLDKLVEKILSLPPDMRFSEVETLLLRFGCEKRKLRGGSHHTFYNPRTGAIIPAVKKGGRFVKRGYLKRIIAELGLESWYEHKGGSGQDS